MVSLIQQLFGGLITLVYLFIPIFPLPFKKVFPNNNLFIPYSELGFDTDDTMAKAYMFKFLSIHFRHLGR
tara:strand:- start:59 stop:268 length:210 start_codon:yes stop_codon:yes gene_type:complete